MPIFLLLGLGAAVAGIVWHERNRRMPASATRPYVDPPTPGVYSVIVLAPSGYFQARRDFPGVGTDDGTAAAEMKNWIAGLGTGGQVIAPRSTWTIYGPAGQALETGQIGKASFF